MSGWRVFIGVDWDEYPQVDWSHLDEVVPDWEQARAMLLEHLDSFEGGCQTCAKRAAEAEASLLAATPGPWEDEVDGETYAIGVA